MIEIGGQPFFLAFHQDISERKQAEQDLIAAKEQAERANKLKDAFIANVSHEIRTPLNIILGYTDIIEDTFARVSTKDELRYFGAVREGSNRLMRTVDLILNTSRAVTGDITLLPTEIDLPALIGKTVRDFAHRAEEKSITLNASNLVGNITALLDENIFWQVLVNLLDNAIKYTKEGGITVELYREGEEVYLDVRDTGIGMEEEFLERLFDPYTQEQVGYTRGYEGIGLGLALTKHYLCLHQIPISVRSIKGEGTTFTLCLTGVVKTGAVSDNQ
jgi:signal transduction histidine kinase